MTTLKLTAESSLCQLSSLSKSWLFWLYSAQCLSWIFFAVYWSNLTFRDFLQFSPSWPLALSTSSGIHRFPCFCWSLASSKVRIIENTCKNLYSNKNEKPPNKAQKSTTLTDQTKKIQGGSTCWNAIFKLSITLSVSVERRLQTADCRLQTVDCRLQTGVKMQTEGKMNTTNKIQIK